MIEGGNMNPEALMKEAKDMLKGINKPEPIIMINDEIAFKRSEFKRARKVENGVEIYFVDGSKEVASNMKLQEILNKIG